MRNVPPVTPGEKLDEEFLKPLGLTKYRLAKDIGVPLSELATLSRASGTLPQTRTFGCAVTLGSVMDGGFAGKRITTSRSPAKRWETRFHVLSGASGKPRE